MSWTCPNCGNEEFRRHGIATLYTNGEWWHIPVDTFCDDENENYECVECDHAFDANELHDLEQEIRTALETHNDLNALYRNRPRNDE